MAETRSPSRGHILNLLGTEQVFLAEPTENEGKMLMLEMRLPPGTGLTTHRHVHEDEAFYGLSGQLRIAIEGQDDAVLGPGDYVYAPRGKAHALSCEGDTEARFLGIALPGDNIAGMYAAIEQAARAGEVTPEDVARICAAFDISFM